MNLLRFAPTVALFVFGCGPSTPTTKPQTAPDCIAAEQLVGSYARRVYDGRRIQVFLADGTYRVRGGRIEAVLCGPHEQIRFETASTPPEGNLIVTGVCRGVVTDGVERCGDPRLTWYVRVTECAVSPAP